MVHFVGDLGMPAGRTPPWFARFVLNLPSLSYNFHRDPVISVRQMKPEADGRPKGGKGILSTSTKQQKGIEGLTLAELRAKWSYVVETLKEDGVKVINPDHALEGALLIRCVYP